MQMMLLIQLCLPIMRMLISLKVACILVLISLYKYMHTNVMGDFWAQLVKILVFPSPTSYML